MTKAIRLIYKVIIFFLVIFSCKCGVGVSYAATTTYSNVLNDLQTDTEFDASIYPAVDDDYSLQVIQIAESTNGELFLYVYQPSAQAKVLTATSVNMSLSETVDGTQLYDLKLLSNTSVFQKYLVEGVTVSSDEIRYYNISSIFRPWIDGIDEEPAEGQTISEVPYKVGKLYTAYKDNGTIHYTCIGQEVIPITSKYCGFVSYWSGTNPWTEYYCDAHYIAFNTDRDIDRVKNANVEFYWQTIKENDGGIGNNSTIDNGKKIVKLNDVEDATVTPRGWFQGNNYSWKRIRTVEQFIEEENITDEALLAELKDKAFVLNFFETEYSKTGPYGGFFEPHYYTATYSRLYDETILRLEFEQDGKTYNLGAVDNKQTNNNENPDNQSKLSAFDKFCQWLESVTGVPAIVWKIIIIAIPICIILGVLSAIFPIVWTVVKFVLKGLWLIIKYISIGLWYVISSPFRLIIWLVNRGKNNTQTE